MVYIKQTDIRFKIRKVYFGFNNLLPSTHRIKKKRIKVFFMEKLLLGGFFRCFGKLSHTGNHAGDARKAGESTLHDKRLMAVHLRLGMNFFKLAVIKIVRACMYFSVSTTVFFYTPWH